MHLGVDPGTTDTTAYVLVVDGDHAHHMIYLANGAVVVGLTGSEGTWSSYDRDIQQILTTAMPEPLELLQRPEPYLPRTLQDWEYEPAGRQDGPSGPATPSRAEFRPSGQIIAHSWPPTRAPPGPGRGRLVGSIPSRPTGRMTKPRTPRVKCPSPNCPRLSTAT